VEKVSIQSLVYKLFLKRTPNVRRQRLLTFVIVFEINEFTNGLLLLFFEF